MRPSRREAEAVRQATTQPEALGHHLERSCQILLKDQSILAANSQSRAGLLPSVMTVTSVKRIFGDTGGCMRYIMNKPM